MSKGGPIPPENGRDALQWFASKLDLLAKEADGDEFIFGVFTEKLCIEVNSYDRPYQAKISRKMNGAYLRPRLTKKKEKPKLEVVK